MTRRAFTLIELVATLVVLGVVVGVVTPRLLSTDTRRAEEEARALALLVTRVAQRDALGGERLALVHDEREAEVRLMVERTPRGATRERRGADPERVWTEDPAATPASLEHIVIDQVYIDGARERPEGWRWDVAPGAPRPALDLVLLTAEDVRPPRAWRISLRPWHTVARFADAESRDESPEPIDLDEAGDGEAPW